MCELLALSTRHAAHLNVSLEALASHSGPACGTRDGLGAAFYQGNDVALFREPVAASFGPAALENCKLELTAMHAWPSRCSAIRCATRCPP